MFANKPEFVAATQDAKDVLTELPALVDAFVRIFQGKYGLLFTVLAALLIAWYFLFKASPSGLLAYHQTRRRSRFEALEKYLSNADARDHSCVQTINEIYDAECFEQATGIYAERTKRSALVSLYGQVNQVASWRTIKAAQDFLEFNDPGIATIRPLTRWDRLCRRTNKICAIVTISIGFLAIPIFCLSPGNRLVGLLEGMGVYFLFLFFGFLFLRETVQYECAERIRNRLQSYPDLAPPVIPAARAAPAPADAGIPTP